MRAVIQPFGWTLAETREVTVAGVSLYGLQPVDFTVFGSKVLFLGNDASDHYNLWVTDGTGAGTSELTVSGAYSVRLSDRHGNDPDIAVLGSKALFQGLEAGIGLINLWVTDGTPAGTSQLTVAGAHSSGLF